MSGLKDDTGDGWVWEGGREGEGGGGVGEKKRMWRGLYIQQQLPLNLHLTIFVTCYMLGT